MRWSGRRQSGNIVDRRGGGGSRMGGRGFRIGGGGGGFGRGGGFGGGLGILIVVGLVLLFGGDLGSLFGGREPQESSRSHQGTASEEELKQFTAVVLADTEDVWHEVFRERGATYQEPQLVLYTGGTQTGCGYGQSAYGPFYCPADRRIYIDLTFFRELGSRFGAPGDFAAAYVIAHEVGHHVQLLLGIERQVREAQARTDETGANQLQVRMELQADCFSGLWARQTEEAKQVLEAGDLDEALGAAHAVGDDTLQRAQTGRVVPDSFTHGSAEQRQRWFMRGFEQGTVEACDTFSAQQL